MVVNAPAVSGYEQYSVGGQMYYLSADTNAYNTGRQSVWATGNQTISLHTQTAITGMSVAVGVGEYVIHAVVQITGTSAHNAYVTIGGTALASLFYCFISGDAYVAGNTQVQTPSARTRA